MPRPVSTPTFIPETLDGKHRLWLRRSMFGPLMEPPDVASILWVMLNPSVANTVIDDPTMNRVKRFTKRFGYDQLYVANLFTLRSPDPSDIDADALESNHNDADAVIEELAGFCRIAICAWGSGAAIRNRGGFKIREQQVKDMLHDATIPTYCLGLTGDGHPRHPLYLPKTTEMERFAT